MPEKTDRACPQCHQKGLIAYDDPNQDHWGSTTQWDCPACGYHAFSDFDLESEENYEGDDDDDFEDDDDLLDDIEITDSVWAGDTA